jgi:hypothetical protein
MKRIVLATALILSIAAPAAAQSPARAGADPQTCDVSVDFGSYASGIDQASYRKTKAYDARNRTIRLVKETPWGREGERTLCFDTRSRADANRAFDDLRAMIRAGARTGPTTVSTAAGRTWTSAPPSRS